jgi:hypothetical protein
MPGVVFLKRFQSARSTGTTSFATLLFRRDVDSVGAQAELLSQLRHLLELNWLNWGQFTLSPKVKVLNGGDYGSCIRFREK